MRTKHQYQVTSYLLILPAAFMVIFFLILPMFQNIYYSFYEWDGLTEPVFNGVKNYINMFTDSNFLVSFRNTIIWVVFTLIFPVMGGLLVAIFLRGIKYDSLFKTIFFIPLTISFVSTSMIWRYMFSFDFGVINTSLSLLAGKEVGIAWLTDVPLNTFSMLIAWTWQQLGVNMALFLMGLTSIPQDPIEAALIDGASKWKTFVHVTFPMLRPTTTVVITMAIVNSFKAFDIIYVTTWGGPYRSSETLAVTMFRETFTMFRMGYGAAIAVLLSIIVIAISGFYIKNMTQKDLLYY